MFVTIISVTYCSKNIVIFLFIEIKIIHNQTFLTDTLIDIFYARIAYNKEILRRFYLVDKYEFNFLDKNDIIYN